MLDLLEVGNIRFDKLGGLAWDLRMKLETRRQIILSWSCGVGRLLKGVTGLKTSNHYFLRVVIVKMTQFKITFVEKPSYHLSINLSFLYLDLC